jgi:hypothetical protein
MYMMIALETLYFSRKNQILIKDIFKSVVCSGCNVRVILCDIDGGGLCEMSFLIHFWPLNTIPLNFLQKFKTVEMLGWVKNPFFTSKIQKVRFFKKFFHVL